MNNKLCKVMPPTVERFLMGARVYSEDEVMAMLTEIQLDIEELRAKKHFQHKHGQEHGLNDALNIIQQKINTLRGNENE